MILALFFLALIGPAKAAPLIARAPSDTVQSSAVAQPSESTVNLLVFGMGGAILLILLLVLFKQSQIFGKADVAQVFTTFFSAGLGLLILLTIFGVTTLYSGDETQAKNVGSIAGTAIAMIGTLVGFVAGQAAGAAGKAKSDERAARAEERATGLSGLARPEEVKDVLERHPELFGLSRGSSVKLNTPTSSKEVPGQG